jgi:hypothetical protein
MLLDAGADVNYRFKAYDPADNCLRSVIGDKELFNMLLAAGANGETQLAVESSL